MRNTGVQSPPLLIPLGVWPPESLWNNPLSILSPLFLYSFLGQSVARQPPEQGSWEQKQLSKPFTAHKLPFEESLEGSQPSLCRDHGLPGMLTWSRKQWVAGPWWERCLSVPNSQLQLPRGLEHLRCQWECEGGGRIMFRRKWWDRAIIKTCASPPLLCLPLLIPHRPHPTHPVSGAQQSLAVWLSSLATPLDYLSQIFLQLHCLGLVFFLFIYLFIWREGSCWQLPEAPLKSLGISPLAGTIPGARTTPELSLASLPSSHPDSHLDFTSESAEQDCHLTLLSAQCQDPHSGTHSDVIGAEGGWCKGKDARCRSRKR